MQERPTSGGDIAMEGIEEESDKGKEVEVSDDDDETIYQKYCPPVQSQSYDEIISKFAAIIPIEWESVAEVPQSLSESQIATSQFPAKDVRRGAEASSSVARVVTAGKDKVCNDEVLAVLNIASLFVALKTQQHDSSSDELTTQEQMDICTRRAEMDIWLSQQKKASTTEIAELYPPIRELKVFFSHSNVKNMRKK